MTFIGVALSGGVCKIGNLSYLCSKKKFCVIANALKVRSTKPHGSRSLCSLIFTILSTLLFMRKCLNNKAFAPSERKPVLLWGRELREES